MSELKIFRIDHNIHDEKEWIAAHTNIEAIKEYCSITSTDLVDFDDIDEIVEVPKSEWSKLTVKNTDYNASDPSDWKEMTFEEWIKDKKSADIIAGTMYE